MATQMFRRVNPIVGITTSGFIKMVKVHNSTARKRFFSASLSASKGAPSVNVVRPSADEVATCKLGERNLEIAVRSIHEDGIVVVEDAVPVGPLDFLNKKMVEDAYVLQARGEDGPFNYNLGNLQQDAPPWAEFFDPAIFMNRIGTQITSSVLGPLPKWTFCSANAAMPPVEGQSPSRQPVHSDADFDHPTHPFALVINVPLIDMYPDNGSTEVWPGTHRYSSLDSQEGRHGERTSGRIREDVLRNWSEKVAPSPPKQQPVIKKGSLVVRDLRLWHAGMPNYTSDVRIMLAFIHYASWFRNRMRLEMADDIKPIWEGLQAKGELGGLNVSQVDWVDRDEVMKRYLGRGFGNSYDFDQIP